MNAINQEMRQNTTDGDGEGSCERGEPRDFLQVNLKIGLCLTKVITVKISKEARNVYLMSKKDSKDQ